MYRIEIVSNKSVEEDITDALVKYVPGILYTKIPLAYGKGKKSCKEGTATWPETNFIMISYIEDSQMDKVREVMAAVKNKFPDEGIKLFAIHSE